MYQVHNVNKRLNANGQFFFILFLRKGMETEDYRFVVSRNTQGRGLHVAPGTLWVSFASIR